VRQRVGAETDDAECAAMEIAGTGDDVRLVRRHTLHFITPFARDLERRLHGFRAAVHWQNRHRAGEFLQVLI
jgi:hypothetical protein